MPGELPSQPQGPAHAASRGAARKGQIAARGDCFRSFSRNADPAPRVCGALPHRQRLPRHGQGREKPGAGAGSGARAVLVAAKVMDRKELQGRNKEGSARTEREILKAVDHPFLPRLYGVAEGDSWSCLLTEICPNGDLHVLRQRHPHRRFSEAAVRLYF